MDWVATETFFVATEMFWHRFATEICVAKGFRDGSSLGRDKGSPYVATELAWWEVFLLQQKILLSTTGLGTSACSGSDVRVTELSCAQRMQQWAIMCTTHMTARYRNDCNRSRSDRDFIVTETPLSRQTCQVANSALCRALFEPLFMDTVQKKKMTLGNWGFLVM